MVQANITSTALSVSNLPSPRVQALPLTPRAAEPALSRTIAPASFVLLALELVGFCTLFWAYIVFRHSHPSLAAAPAASATPWWIFQSILLALAVLTAWRILPHLAGRRRSAAMLLSGIALLYGITAAGIKAMELLSRNRQPVVIHLPDYLPARVGGIPVAAVSEQPLVPAGDAAAGRGAYLSTCAGCHGAAGEGMAGIAPSLKENALTMAADSGPLAAVIANGRQANDPANKSGKVMPPRGGNPFLAEGDILNIVAFLRGSSTGAGGAMAVGAAPDAAALLPRWVVGGAARPSASVLPAIALPDDEFARPALRRRHAAATSRIFAGLFDSAYLIHLLIGLGALAGLLWQSYGGRLEAGDLRPARFARLHWGIALVAWGLIVPILYFV